MTDGTNPMKLYRSIFTYPLCKLDRFEEYTEWFSQKKGLAYKRASLLNLF